MITRDVADPRVGFVTVTSVETTQDLRHAKVWVSVIGQSAERDAAVDALRHAMPFIRHELGKRLRIKRIRTCTSISTTRPSAGRGSSSSSRRPTPGRSLTPTCR